MKIEEIKEWVGVGLLTGIAAASLYVGITSRDSTQKLMRDVNNDGKPELMCKMPGIGWFGGMIEENRKPTWLDAGLNYLGKEMPGRDYDILDRMDGVDPITRDLDLFVQSQSLERCALSDNEKSPIFNLTSEGIFLDTGLKAELGISGIYSGATISTFFFDGDGNFISKFP